VELHNLYGPTEATVDVTYWQCQRDSHLNKVPIGRPIANIQIYILEPYLQPVPIGVPGELHISGVGLARGYLNRPDLTAEKFIKNPFSDDPDARLYKTGDLARYLPDGNIEYLGRIDNQVKIRGFRIELGEIEAVLATHPAVIDNVVIVHHSSGDKRLVSYLIPNQGQAIDNTELRTFLKDRLPDYMIPSAFVTLESLPLTPNGKIDRRALSQLSVESYPLSEETFVAPRTPEEGLLAGIWSEVLGVEQVGVRDNFFELGGHSLLAVTLLNRIEKRFGKNIPLTTLFQAPTIEQLALLISQEKVLRDSSLVIIQAGNGKRPPLFFIQVLGNGLEFCLPLAHHLGPEQPVYGLSIGIMGKKQIQSIRKGEEARDHYLKEIQTIQPEGPYFLAGIFCGGRTAFEIAQTLHSQGHEVALLALFDTRMVIQGKVPTTITRRQRFFAHYHLLKKVGLAYLINKGKTRFKKLFNKFNRRYKKLACEFYKRTGRPMSVTLQQFVFQEEEAKLEARTTFTYLPKNYPGKLTLFRAIEQKAFNDPEPGWRNVAEEGIELHDVPGDHLSMLQEPHVQVLAEELKACIDKSQE
jgi:aspartate racemase